MSVFRRNGAQDANIFSTDKRFYPVNPLIIVLKKSDKRLFYHFVFRTSYFVIAKYWLFLNLPLLCVPCFIEYTARLSSAFVAQSYRLRRTFCPIE